MEVTTLPLRWTVTVGLTAQLPGAAEIEPATAGDGSGLKPPGVEAVDEAPPEASVAGVNGVKTSDMV
jgi:hypothetical protein